MLYKTYQQYGRFLAHHKIARPIRKSLSHSVRLLGPWTAATHLSFVLYSEKSQTRCMLWRSSSALGSVNDDMLSLVRQSSATKLLVLLSPSQRTRHPESSTTCHLHYPLVSCSSLSGWHVICFFNIAKPLIIGTSFFRSPSHSISLSVPSWEQPHHIIYPITVG